jgi:Mn-dependent DtxR family transcriptional regulator
MLGKSEVRLLQTLQREGEKITISSLSRKMGLSPSWASELVGSLREKGFVEVERRKKKKLVFFAGTKHAQLMEDLLGRFDYMDFSGLLSGGALGVLYALDRERSVKDVAYVLGTYRASAHRILKRLMERGVVKKRDAKYSLNPDFARLNEIARETVYYSHRKRAMKLSPGATIVWEDLREFVAKAPVAKESKGFHLTGPSKLGDYGVPLLAPRANYYFYSERKERADLYDVVVHTLLIDPRSTRYITYLLIVLAKSKVDEKSLLERAEVYGVTEEARSLLDFIRTKGKVRGEYFPTWAEFSEKALSYGVEV